MFNSNSKLNLGGLRIGPLQIHNNYICKHNKDGAVPVINPDRLHRAHGVDGVYFRSERRWTYECSCQWSQTGSDTSGALQHRPHHPAQHKSESACGALRWIKEIRQFSGERWEGKGNKANCHTNWVKTWFSAALKKKTTLKLYKSKSEGISLFGLRNNASGCFRCPHMDYRNLLYQEGWVTSR